jgi:hydrogenase maturation protein HypF
MTAAASVRVHGVVQGVGFRPFVFRLAKAHALCGWVSNEEAGVTIHLEGDVYEIDAFVTQLKRQPPVAARIAAMEIESIPPAGFHDFSIRESRSNSTPTVRISPDLPVCEDCLHEMRNPADPRYRYPYINCVNCGPRYTVVQSLPYDRAATTMSGWEMDAICTAQYADPADRRFHAQPLCCPQCGPHYRLDGESGEDWRSIVAAAERLRNGALIAVKGIGGYHLVCDAHNAEAVARLRERKFRKEKPFAVMARTLDRARMLCDLNPDAEALLTSAARPIVLAPCRVELSGVAPDNSEIGVMLPYAPLHHLLFDAGAPDVLVMTSANRSSEPIAYREPEGRAKLEGIADAFLIGERPIARRVDDSVARSGPFGRMILRRSRGYSPGAVTSIPASRPILALGADLKNAVTLVINGQAFVSQHIGDLDQFDSLTAFEETIADLTAMYGVDSGEAILAYDAHPQYVSTQYAESLPTIRRRIAVQHHRAHIASVLSERQAWDKRVLGISFDGTGYGDDGHIWGGEFFAGSVAEGFMRVAHLREASLPGGDAAARWPVQAAAGFLAQIETPRLEDSPFCVPIRYQHALELARKSTRTFRTTSMGRLFDAAAALLGFIRDISFEGQAAIWLEQLARREPRRDAFPFPAVSSELDFRPLLESVIRERVRGRPRAEIARAFHFGVATGVCNAAISSCEDLHLDTIVLSGGVFQNSLLLEDIRFLMKRGNHRIWSNSAVPPNDGGISLGQAAIAAFAENRHA